MKRKSACTALALLLAAAVASGCTFVQEDTGGPTPPAPQVETAGEATGTPSNAGSLRRITVPDVVDKDVQAALEALEAAGLRGMIRWRRDSADHRTVLSQSQPAGLMLAPGAFVQLVVSLGPAPKVPDPPYLAAARKAAATAAAATSEDPSSSSTTGSSTSASSPDDGAPSGGGFTNDPNDIPGIPLPTSPVSGTLVIGDPDDVYRVLISAGKTITLSVNPGSSSSNPDFHIRVFVPTATTLDGSPAATTGTGAYPRNLTYTATTTGYFFIDVHHAGTNPASGGDYTLTWSMGS